MSKMLILFDIAKRLGLYPYIHIKDIGIYEDYIDYWEGPNQEKLYETEVLYAIQSKIEELMEDE